MTTLNLLINDVFEDALLLDYETSASGTANLLSVAEGDRYMSVTVTPADTLSYIKKTGNLSADTLVLTRADLFVGDNITFKSYSGYPATSETIYDGTSFSPTLVGHESQDFYHEFTAISGKEAMGLQVPNNSVIHQLYYGTRIEFDFISEVVEFEKVSERIQIEDRYYFADEHYFISLTAVTQAQVNSLNEKDVTNKLVFLYDESGKHFPNKLLHGVILNKPKVEVFDDLYTVSWDIYRVKGYA